MEEWASSTCGAIWGGSKGGREGREVEEGSSPIHYQETLSVFQWAYGEDSPPCVSSSSTAEGSPDPQVSAPPEEGGDRDKII